MSQREAVDKAVTSLRAAGVLRDSDQAEVAMVEALASQVDRCPVFDPELWREYRLAVKALRQARPDDNNDDEISKLIEAIRGATPVGDAAD